MSRVKGEIVSAKEDAEHNRALFILTKDDRNEMHFYIYTNKRLYDKTKDISQNYFVEGSQVIPFYSPESKTQFIIYTPDQNDDGIFRVFEYNSNYNISKPMKVLAKEVQSYIRDKGEIHTMLSTNLERNLVFINDSDMVVIDLQSATK